nr:MAG TPA: hypothetical protein [Caudoviricetes sp.]
MSITLMVFASFPLSPDVDSFIFDCANLRCLCFGDSSLVLVTVR